MRSFGWVGGHANNVNLLEFVNFFVMIDNEVGSSFPIKMLYFFNINVLKTYVQWWKMFYQFNSMET
jgi:hypothetical protein